MKHNKLQVVAFRQVHLYKLYDCTSLNSLTKMLIDWRRMANSDIYIDDDEEQLKQSFNTFAFKTMTGDTTRRQRELKTCGLGHKD